MIITNSKVTSDKIYADIYQEIADALGEETAVAIYELFKGQQIIFPQKLYRKEYIYNILRSVIPEKMFVNYPRSSDIPTGVSARSSAVCQRKKMKIERLPSNIPEILN